MRRFLLWTSTLGAALLATAACSDEVTQQPNQPSSSSSGGQGGQGGGGQGGMPTGPGGGGSGGQGGVGECAAANVIGPVLAVDHWYLGDTDTNGTPSPTAWQSFGDNLDALTTQNGTLTGHCQPNAGGSPNALNDGPGGLDNSFGKLLIPIFTGLAADFSQTVNDSVNNGDSTLMVLLEMLSSADADPIHSKIYPGATRDTAPLWDGGDCWRILPDGLANPSDLTPKLSFPASAVASDAWTTEVATGPLEIPIAVAGYVMTLRIGQVRMRAQLDADHRGASAGIIAGVLDTEALIEEMRKLAGSFDQSLCSGSTFQSLADQFRQASDIMKDGSQDPNATCDGISIGIGFTMSAVELGSIAPAQPPPDDPCAP